MRVIKKLKLKTEHNGILVSVVSVDYDRNEIYIYERNFVCGYIEFDTAILTIK